MSYVSCRQACARAAIAFLLLNLTQCSGKTESSPSDEGSAASGGAGGGAAGSVAAGGSGAGTAGSAGAGTVNGGAGGVGAACGQARSTPVGRPQAVACPATAAADFGDAGAGSIACQVDADCPIDSEFSCLHGVCAPDGCLVDADCPSGAACRCASQQGGNIEHRNTCVAVQCHVDSDCGANGACSPTFSGFCGSLTGYNCHSSADTCNSDADCCDTTPDCEYQPALGHFACQAFAVCNG